MIRISDDLLHHKSLYGSNKDLFVSNDGSALAIALASWESEVGVDENSKALLRISHMDHPDTETRRPLNIGTFRSHQQS